MLKLKREKILLKILVKTLLLLIMQTNFLFTLSASFGTLSIVSHATVVGIHVGLAGASLTVISTLTTGVVKKILNITRKKKKIIIK